MRYGFYLPTRGPTATRQGVLALAVYSQLTGIVITVGGNVSWLLGVEVRSLTPS